MIRAEASWEILAAAEAEAEEALVFLEMVARWIVPVVFDFGFCCTESEIGLAFLLADEVDCLIILDLEYGLKSGGDEDRFGDAEEAVVVAAFAVLLFVTDDGVAAFVDFIIILDFEYGL